MGGSRLQLSQPWAGEEEEDRAGQCAGHIGRWAVEEQATGLGETGLSPKAGVARKGDGFGFGFGLLESDSVGKGVWLLCTCREGVGRGSLGFIGKGVRVKAVGRELHNELFFSDTTLIYFKGHFNILLMNGD